jgi:hypothetical protein
MASILDKILCMYGIGCNSGVHSSDTNYPICLSSCNCLCLLSRDIETQQTSRFCCKLLTASKHLFYVQCISIKSKCIAHAMYVKQKVRLTRLYSKQGDQSFLIYGVIQFCERTWRWKVEDNAPWHQNFTRMSNLARNKCHAFADQR